MKIKTTLFTFILFLALSATAHASCPDGSFNAVGWNPGADQAGKESYKGTATIKTLGEVCLMDWIIGNQTFSGIGAYDPTSKILNISYADPKNGWFGLVWYKDNGATLEGRWTMYGSKDGKLGKETLTRK